MQDRLEVDWNPESGLDVLLMLLYANDGTKQGAPVNGITRLDKLMFLLSKTEEFEHLFEDDYSFTAYNYGPYATELLDDIEALEVEGLLVSEGTSSRSDASETKDAETIEEETGELDVTSEMYPFVSYRLTSEGMEIAKHLHNCLTDQQKLKLEKVKSAFNRVPLSSLLKYVYEEFPESASESLIKDKVFKKQA